jgi:hypothetical protein
MIPKSGDRFLKLPCPEEVGTNTGQYLLRLAEEPIFAHELN